MSAEEAEVGRRSSSPPGRESREDWKGGERNNTEETSYSKADKERSRSRSPRDNGSAFKGKRETREQRFIREGTNTNSREPHLQRARLFVGNIEPDKTHRKDLIELFSRYGDVLGVSVHKGYAFVQMDRERNANRAVNGEDNHNFMGSRIHVEFSQAALKAGAKFERISSRDSPPAPPQEVLRSQHSPRVLHPSLAMLEIEREREQRLSRILSMERELALLRSHEESATRRPPPSSDAAYDRYDRYDAYRRDRSPPRRELDYLSQRDFPLQRDHPPRDDRMGYEGSRGDDNRGRNFYNGHSNSPGGRGGVGGASGLGGDGPGSTGGGDSFRGAISYPLQARIGGYERRDGSQFSSSILGYGGSRGSGSGIGQTSGQSVGYGSSVGKVGIGGAPPPGWPSSDYDKSNANRPPFAWN